jgi:hypothetical protein
MKVSTENDNKLGYEKITIVVDNIPLINRGYPWSRFDLHQIFQVNLFWHIKSKLQ